MTCEDCAANEKKAQLVGVVAGVVLGGAICFVVMRRGR